MGLEEESSELQLFYLKLQLENTHNLVEFSTSGLMTEQKQKHQICRDCEIVRFSVRKIIYTPKHGARASNRDAGGRRQYERPRFICFKKGRLRLNTGGGVIERERSSARLPSRFVLGGFLCAPVFRVSLRAVGVGEFGRVCVFVCGVRIAEEDFRVFESDGDRECRG